MSKAIIVAAGRGRRLGPETDDIPKCMVEVAGRPILHWQLSALAAAGVSDVVVVRGYQGQRISAPQSLRFVENPGWQTNNILASLFHAADEMKGGFFFSYADIVFAPAVAQALSLAAAEALGADAALVVDRRWRDAYEGRTQHPVAEAELARVEGTGSGALVTRVGKQAVPAEDAAGEFIGLAYFSPTGAEALREVWERALRDGGLDAPFGRAATLRNAYLSDALNAAADAGARLTPVFIDGTWREIDTQQDLANAALNAALWE